MFLHPCVILFTGGLHSRGRRCLHPGVSTSGCVWIRGGLGRPSPEHFNKWAICILLECILVSEAYVILSGGRGFPLWTETHPPSPPNRDLPSGLTFSGGHWSGRYASHWNACLSNLSIKVTLFNLFAEPMAYSELSMRQNAAILDYCRTSMSALSGATAGIIGLTGLYGFIFYFIIALMLSVS